MAKRRDRTCLHCGKLFTHDREVTRRRVPEFCSRRCQSRFLDLYDTCFVQGCGRRHYASGLCLSHSSASAREGFGAMSSAGSRRQQAASRLNSLLGYGLVRRAFTAAAERDQPPSQGFKAELELDQVRIIRSPLS